MIAYNFTNIAPIHVGQVPLEIPSFKEENETLLASNKLVVAEIEAIDYGT